MVRPRGVGEVDGSEGGGGVVAGYREAHVVGDGGWRVEVDGLQLEIVPVLRGLGRRGGAGVEEEGIGRVHQDW